MCYDCSLSPYVIYKFIIMPLSKERCNMCAASVLLDSDYFPVLHYKWHWGSHKSCCGENNKHCPLGRAASWPYENMMDAVLDIYHEYLLLFDHTLGNNIDVDTHTCPGVEIHMLQNFRVVIEYGHSLYTLQVKSTFMKCRNLICE